MLKNIVFDMGNVLIKWTPYLIMDLFGITEEEDRQFLLDHMFHTKEWVLQDWGVMDEEDTEKRIFAITPERLHEAIHGCLFHWPDRMVPVLGMEALMKELKEKGYNLYVLSNASRKLNNYYQRLPGAEYLSGYVVSASEGLLKPQPEIFRCLLDRYGLKAEESLFVDDLILNCAGAAKVGMDAFHFKMNVDDLRSYIFSKA